MSEYDVLFTPFKIGQLEIRNRIVMCPMGTNAAYSDGTISENKIDLLCPQVSGRRRHDNRGLPVYKPGAGFGLH